MMILYRTNQTSKIWIALCQVLPTRLSIDRSCMNNVPDVSSGTTLPVCDHVIAWISKLEINRDVIGTVHSASVKTMTDKVKEIAKPNTNKEYQKRQLRRVKVLQGLSEKF